MNYTPLFVFLLFVGASIGGFFGALLGIGGGLFMVPMMALVCHLPMKVAVATSIVAVIATSNAGGSKYVERRITNLRLSMLLEIATTIGALIGAVMAMHLPDWVLLFVFAGVLVNMAWSNFRSRKLDDERIAAGGFTSIEQSRLAKWLQLRGSYYDEAAQKQVDYLSSGVGKGSFISLMAGVASGMLGIGGGALKVSGMNRHMNVPMKVAVGSSKLMIGITAAVSALLFFAAGALHFALVGPVALGTTFGATLGTRVMNRLKSSTLKKMLFVLMLYMAYAMIVKACEVRFGLHLPNFGA